MVNKKKKLDAEPLLRQLAEMRKSIPYLQETGPRQTGDGRLPDGRQPRTAEEFEYLALADGLESFAADLSASIEWARARSMEAALKIYYAAEELAKDPEHADLIPHVEKMRAAYLKDFGKPIPPKPKSE